MANVNIGKPDYKENDLVTIIGPEPEYKGKVAEVVKVKVVKGTLSFLCDIGSIAIWRSSHNLKPYTGGQVVEAPRTESKVSSPLCETNNCKYKGYSISKDKNDNYKVTTPKGIVWSDRAANMSTAKQWIDADRAAKQWIDAESKNESKVSPKKFILESINVGDSVELDGKEWNIVKSDRKHIILKDRNGRTKTLFITGRAKVERVQKEDKEIKDYSIETNPETPKERTTVKVTFADGNSLVSTINGDLEKAKKYYLGRTFNVGKGAEDNLVKAVKVELAESKKLTEDTQDKTPEYDLGVLSILTKEAQEHKNWAEKNKNDKEWMSNTSETSLKMLDNYLNKSVEELAKEDYDYLKMRAGAIDKSGNHIAPDAFKKWNDIADKKLPNYRYDIKSHGLVVDESKILNKVYESYQKEIIMENPFVGDESEPKEEPVETEVEAPEGTSKATVVDFFKTLLLNDNLSDEAWIDWIFGEIEDLDLSEGFFKTLEFLIDNEIGETEIDSIVDKNYQETNLEGVDEDAIKIKGLNALVNESPESEDTETDEPIEEENVTDKSKYSGVIITNESTKKLNKLAEDVIKRFTKEDILQKFESEMGLALQKQEVTPEDKAQYQFGPADGAEKYTAGDTTIFIGDDRASAWYFIFFNNGTDKMLSYPGKTNVPVSDQFQKDLDQIKSLVGTLGTPPEDEISNGSPSPESPAPESKPMGANPYENSGEPKATSEEPESSPAETPEGETKEPTEETPEEPADETEETPEETPEGEEDEEEKKSKIKLAASKEVDNSKKIVESVTAPIGQILSTSSRTALKYSYKI